MLVELAEEVRLPRGAAATWECSCWYAWPWMKGKMWCCRAQVRAMESAAKGRWLDRWGTPVEGCATTARRGARQASGSDGTMPWAKVVVKDRWEARLSVGGSVGGWWGRTW